jgi:hypothetical protein
MKMKKRQRIDLTIILVWPIIASLLSFLLQVNVLGATILFMVLPGVYLSIIDRKCVPRAALFSLIALPLVFTVEYFAIKNGAWFFRPEALILPDLLGTVAFEAVIWYFSWIYLIIMFYEHFLDKDAHTKLGSPRLKYLIFAFMILFLVLLFLVLNKLSTTIPYYYFFMGFIMLGLPIPLILFKFPQLFTKLAKITLYFTYMHLTLDLTEISLGHWYYPGQFIGWFELFGLRLPVEELAFFVVLSAAAVISWYQYFDEAK